MCESSHKGPLCCPHCHTWCNKDGKLFILTGLWIRNCVRHNRPAFKMEKWPLKTKRSGEIGVEEDMKTEPNDKKTGYPPQSFTFTQLGKHGKKSTWLNGKLLLSSPIAGCKRRHIGVVMWGGGAIPFNNCILWQTLNKTIKYIDKASFAYRRKCCRKSGSERKWENKPQYLQGLRHCLSKLHIYTSGHSALHQLQPPGTPQPLAVIWKAATSAPPSFFLPLWPSTPFFIRLPIISQKKVYTSKVKKYFIHLFSKYYLATRVWFLVIFGYFFKYVIKT